MAHFKYFQSILLKYDDSSLDKSYLIHFFYNGFRPLIKVQIQNGGQKLYNQKNLMQKAIKAKAKTSFLHLSKFQEMDQRIACNKQLVESTKSSSQKPIMRILRAKDSKFWNQNSKSTVLQLSKFANKARKKTKKNQHNQGQDYGQDHNA